MYTATSDDSRELREDHLLFIDPAYDIEMEAACEIPPEEAALYTDPTNADSGGRNTTAWD